MSEHLYPTHAVAIRRGRNSLPIGLKWGGLVRSQGIETVRIRFLLDLDKSIDLPVSAEILAELGRLLGALHGKTPEAIPDEIEYLRQLGVVLEE